MSNYTQENYLKLVTSEIRNLIFDLGGVIINLDQDQFITRLSLLTGIHVDNLKSDIIHRLEFYDYEKGLISDQEFRDFIRSISSKTASDDEIDDVWNSMLLDIPKQRLELLQRLMTRYRVFLLSNTNNIHLTEAIVKLNKMGYSGFSSLCHTQYYSHILKERKPDKRIYQIVLEDSSITPSETLFLDDNMDNLKGAEELGIQTFHVKHPDLVLELFDAK